MHPRLLSVKLRRDFQAARARENATSVYDTEDLCQQLQLSALKRVWLDAIADVPYYASLVASGRAPRQIDSWSDVHDLPVVTRQTLQDQPHAFVRRSGPSESFTQTAGSTGTPLRIGMNQAERDLMRTVKLSAWMKFGYTPSSRLFLIWGHSHLLGTGWKGKLNHLKRKTADALLGYKRVDAYRLSRVACLEHAEKLLRWRPIGVIGYASALDLFARYTPQFRERFRALDIRFVLATAEPAPNSDTFSFLQDLFGCPVVQEYGGAECGQVAFNTGDGAFDVYSDLNYVECQPPEADTPHAYPVLVTTLYSRYVPLIRYRIGDAVVGPERLMHGHVRRFAAVAGRVNDEIRLNDGDSIHSVAIFHCIHQERAVHNIQMALYDDGIVIRLVAALVDRAALERRLRQRLSQVHPALAQARFEFLEDLQTNRAGKRRWFVDSRSEAQPTN